MIKRLIAAALVVVGTNAWTYAYTRHHTTDTLLTEIESMAWEFLEDQSGPTTVALGTSGFSTTTSDSPRDISYGYYETNLNTVTTYQVIHQASSASVNVNGFGVPHTLNSPDPETFCIVHITRFPT